MIETERALMAEQAVLGAMLIDDECVGSVLAKVKEQDFLRPEHRQIFRAIRALFRGGDPVDGITVRGKLGDDYGALLAQLIDVTPTAGNVAEYVAIMRDQAALRRVQTVAEQLQAAATLDEARPLAAQLTSELAEDGERLNIWTAMDVLTYFQRRQAQPESRPEYISLGITSLDDGAFIEPGDVVVIAGEPSSGKTALGLLTAYHMASTRKVGFFSLETRNEKLADRLIAGQIGIDFERIKRGNLQEEDWQRFAAAGGDFAKRQLSLIPCGGVTVGTIQAITQACGFDVIFLDYAQLIQPELSDRVGSVAQMADVSKRLHMMAQRMGILVVELLQLSRPEAKGKWRPPNMHDLKETGQWEQDADAILMVYAPDPKSEYDHRTTRVISVAKNKEGRRGEGLFTFDGSRQRFIPMAGPDTKALMSKYRDAGKAAKAKRGAPIAGQTRFSEIPNNGDEPF